MSSDGERSSSRGSTPDTPVRRLERRPQNPKGPVYRAPARIKRRAGGMTLTKIDGSRHHIPDSPTPVGEESDRSRSASRTVLRASVSSRRASSCVTLLDAPTQRDVGASLSVNKDVNAEEIPADPAADVKTEETPEQPDDEVFTSDEEFYDTDLDCETTVAQLLKNKSTTDSAAWEDEDEEDTVDVVRKKEYLAACHRHNAVPQYTILRNLGNNVLDLRHRYVGSHQLKPLFIALKENMRVQRLLLDEVGLDKEGAQSLAEGLVENVTVSFLSLAGNPLGTEGLLPVVYLLLKNRHIHTLSLRDTKLGSDTIPLLAHLIKENTSLRFLDLSRNTLEASGMRLLAGAIGENQGLEFLRLSWNHIRLNGAATIGQCLSVNSRLRVLDLSWNGLGYQGAVTLAKSLPENDVLQELDLSHNSIHWDAAHILARGLAKNSSLKILRLGGNPVSTTGAMDLLDAVRTEGNALRLLDLSDVPVILETEVLAASLSQKRNFRLIHGGVVFIHDVFGRRYDRDKKPMERLLEHIRERMLRPLEMLREFDKNSQGHISQEEFMNRLQRAKVPLHPFEVKALTASVSEQKYDGTTVINYAKLMESIENYITLDRIRKWRERMHKEHMRQYHTRILNEGRPLYSRTASSVAMETTFGDTFVSPSAVSIASGRENKQAKDSLLKRASSRNLAASLEKAKQRPPLPLVKSKSTFNMSTPLQEVGLRKKKNKERPQHKPETARSKNPLSRQCSEILPREATTLIGTMKG